MRAAAKLELARAAVEFAEASLWIIKGDGWSASCGGGGGDIGHDRYSIAYLRAEGKSVEEIVSIIDAGMAKRALFDAACKRTGDRLASARERYVVARIAAGVARDPENENLMTKSERDAHFRDKWAK